MSNNKKTPAYKSAPPDKTARRSADPKSFYGDKPRWVISRVDRTSDWGWDKVTLDVLWSDILPKLMSFETMKWSEILQDNESHFIPVKKIIGEAQKRLEELRYDDTGYIFSLRLTGKKRIWGNLEDGVLKIIWYDPEHKVCPSLKKHT